MCCGLPSATSVGLGAISNATAIRRHYTEDVARRPMGRAAEPGRPSALPIVEQRLAGVLDVVEAI